MKNFYSTRYIIEFLRHISDERVGLLLEDKVDGIKSLETRTILKTAADRLEEASKKNHEKRRLTQSFRNTLPISKKAKEVLSRLNPIEQKALLNNFGLLELDGA